MKRELREGEKALFVYYGERREITVCLIISHDAHVMARGAALCSERDQPSKKRGRQIALGRALDIAHRSETIGNMPLRRGIIQRYGAATLVLHQVYQDTKNANGFSCFKQLAWPRMDELTAKESRVVAGYLRRWQRGLMGVKGESDIV